MEAQARSVRRDRGGAVVGDDAHENGAHQAARKHHAGPGDADAQQAPRERKVRLPLGELQRQGGLAAEQQMDGGHGGDGLRKDRGQRGARHAHAGEGAKAENEDGIEQDIQDVRKGHQVHRPYGIARALQRGVAGEQNESGEAAEEKNTQVTHAVGDDRGFGAQQAEQGAGIIPADAGGREAERGGKEDGLAGGFARVVPTLTAGRARDEGHGPGRQAHQQRKQDHEDRAGDGDRRHGVGTEPADPEEVDHALQVRKDGGGDHRRGQPVDAPENRPFGDPASDAFWRDALIRFFLFIHETYKFPAQYQHECHEKKGKEAEESGTAA